MTYVDNSRPTTRVGQVVELSVGIVAMGSDTAYFCRRIEQEREAASRATDERVRLRHLEFAAAYVFYLHEMKAQEQRSALHFLSTGALLDKAPELHEEVVATTAA